jgi:stringent starvation protein B
MLFPDEYVDESEQTPPDDDPKPPRDRPVLKVVK